MKKILFFSLFVLSSLVGVSQVIYSDFYSSKLDETRKIKVQLPRDYDPEEKTVYPIILVLDGDYLFEPVAGNVDYFSYWEDMPPAIIVGIMQSGERYIDTYHDPANFMPSKDGANFFEFIGLELIPYLDKNYNTAKFIIAAGHDVTANFLNFYLFKSPVLFNGYIILSPDLSPQMDTRLITRIPEIKERIFYYMATGTEDVTKLRKSTEALHTQLTELKSEKFNYYFDNFDKGNHYSVVARGIPNALEKIFSVYRPISTLEFNEVLMKTETPLFQYLTERYRTIEDLFGIKIPVRVNDFLAVGTAAEKRKQWDALEGIGKLAKKQHPDNIVGHYFLGRYYEETGSSRRAIHEYNAAYNKEEVDYITVDLLLDRADDLKNRR